MIHVCLWLRACPLPLSLFSLCVCLQMQTGVKSLAVPIGTHRWWWATEEGELVPTQITVSLLKEEADIEAYEAKVEDEKSWALEGYALTS